MLMKTKSRVQESTATALTTAQSTAVMKQAPRDAPRKARKGRALTRRHALVRNCVRLALSTVAFSRSTPLRVHGVSLRRKTLTRHVQVRTRAHATRRRLTQTRRQGLFPEEAFAAKSYAGVNIMVRLPLQQRKR